MLPTNYGDRKPGIKLGPRANVETIRAWRNRVNGLQGGLAKREEAIKAGFSLEEINREFGELTNAAGRT